MFGPSSRSCSGQRNKAKTRLYLATVCIVYPRREAIQFADSFVFVRHLRRSCTVRLLHSWFLAQFKHRQLHIDCRLSVCSATFGFVPVSQFVQDAHAGIRRHNGCVSPQQLHSPQITSVPMTFQPVFVYEDAMCVNWSPSAVLQ